MPKIEKGEKMGRSLKFRAWDGIKMIYDGDIYWPEHFDIDLKRVTGKCTVTHRGIYFWVHETRLSCATEKHFDHCSIRLPEGMQIMQFTGLKDKNGKEIFEGDWLKEYWKPCGDDAVVCGEYVGEVFYEDAGYWTRSKNHHHAITETCDSYEVIGNIYQNKNLLENANPQGKAITKKWR